MTLSDNDALKELSRRIKSNLGNYFEGISGSEQVTGVVWGGQETARTFRFEVSNAVKNHKHVIFAKICPIFEKLDPARMEYDTLQLLQESIPALWNDCRVSRPLDYFPDLNAYAMESVGSNNFRTYLLKTNSRFKSDSSLATLISKVTGSARWLSAFHKVTASKEQKLFRTKSFVESISEDYDYRVLKDYGFGGETIRKVFNVIEELSKLDGKIDLPCAKWHWDFTPGHVFLDNGQISVIDILGAADVPIFEDIGRFLAAMSTVNNLPFHLFFDHARARGLLCNSFIETYQNNCDMDRDKFILLTNIYKLKYLLIWFCGQNERVSSKIHPLAGRLFSELRLVKLFEPSLLQSADYISERL